MATEGEPTDNFASLFVTAPDGLRLHVRSYGPRHGDALPVVCLPGLSRTAADFHPLADALASDPARPRRVLAIDSRGRGRSDHDRDPANYNLAVELNDVLAILTALGVGAAVFVGSSRGGILTMLMGAARPAVVAGAILNDIGPVIEPKGLMRIKSYVGKLPQPKNYEDGAEILRRLADAQFPRLDSSDWMAAARRTWEERKGRLVPTYDVRLAKTLDGIDIERPLPTLWNEFDSLARVPLLAIRGANSDILSAATVEAMQARRPSMQAIAVPDQGHTPLLAELPLIQQIAAFIAVCEASRQSYDHR